MSIIICGANEVEAIVFEKSVTAVLSIEHPGAKIGTGLAPRISTKGITQEFLCFHDVEAQEYTDHPDIVVPTMEHIDTAFAFLESHQNENIIIHCKAGKSRSVGLALAWLVYTSGDIDTAIKQIKAMQSKAAPNMAIIRLSDEKLGLNGKFLKAVDNDQDFKTNRITANASRLKQMKLSGIDPSPEKGLFK